jgi:hypothetical protein
MIWKHLSASLRIFFSLWKDADPDIVGVNDAKNRLAGLKIADA